MKTTNVWMNFSLAAAAIFAVADAGAQNSGNSGDRPAVARPLVPDERARAAAEAARRALSDDEVIRSAEERLRRLKGEDTGPTTITDRNNTGGANAPAGGTRPKPVQPQVLIPEPAAGRPAPKPAALSSRPPAPPPAPLASGGNVPSPAPLRPRYNTAPKSADTGQAVEITAHESIMDEKNNMATFKGDVVVNNGVSEMRSEYLEVFMNDKDNPKLAPDGTRPAFERAIATGSMVEIEQQVIEDGKPVIQIAKSRRAEFNGVTGDTILTGGPPFLQKGDQVIRPEEDSAKIILKNNGQHQVIGRTKVVFPVKGSAGAAGKTPGLPANSLESIRSGGRNSR